MTGKRCQETGQSRISVREKNWPILYPNISGHLQTDCKKGDRVVVGQMIAEAGGFVSAPVYASVSGVVKGIEKRLTATGGYCDAIIVENDEVYESVAFEETKDITQLSKDEIRGKIQKAGIVGMGGAGFPTHVNFHRKNRKRSNTFWSMVQNVSHI